MGAEAVPSFRHAPLVRLVRSLGERPGPQMRASLLVVIHDEAIVVGGRDLLLVCASIEDIQVFFSPVPEVRLNRIAPRSVGRSAEAIDLALERRFDLDEDVAKGLAFDEIVGELIEWSIKIIIHQDVTLVRAN